MKYESDLTMIVHKGGVIRLVGGVYETTDKAEIEILNKHPRVKKAVDKPGSQTPPPGENN